MTTKRLVLLTTAALPCVAAIGWLAMPVEPPAQSVALPEPAPVAMQARADEGARTPDDRGTYPAEEAPKITGHPGEEISAQAPLPAAPPIPSAPPRSTAPPRTQFSTVSPTRVLSGTHIRVLSGGAVPAAGGPLVAATPAATVPGTITLEVDPTLHDPAIWAEEEEQEPVSPAQESVKARIAGEFDAAVAAAVTDPATAKKKGLDRAWREARARANEQYQLFFGAEAANRAALSAGRASLAPP